MRFAVLQLTGCAGCEVSLLNAGDELDLANLAYMPLVVTAHDVPEVDVLLVTGGIRTDEDLLKLRESASRDSVIGIEAGPTLPRKGKVSGWFWACVRTRIIARSSRLLWLTVI